MRKYKDGNYVMFGDRVLISKRWAKNNCLRVRRATVVGLRGFVTVQLVNGTEIDFDMRSLTFVEREKHESR